MRLWVLLGPSDHVVFPLQEDGIGLARMVRNGGGMVSKRG